MSRGLHNEREAAMARSEHLMGELEDERAAREAAAATQAALAQRLHSMEQELAQASLKMSWAEQQVSYKLQFYL